MKTKVAFVLTVGLLISPGFSSGGDEHRCVFMLVPPEYPPLARMAGIQGTIQVRIIIERNGSVSKAEPVPWRRDGQTSADERILRREALNNIRKWRFEPLSAEGPPSELTVEYVFRMEGRASYYQRTENRFQLPSRVEIVTQPPSPYP